MIYNLEIRDHRPVKVKLTLSGLDRKYADIEISTNELDGEKITHAEVLIDDLELAATSLVRERDRKISGGARDCDHKTE